MKYDKMVAITQEESRQKIQFATNTISEMVEQMEKVTVSALIKKTGLSRGFFYKNPAVRSALDSAKYSQATGSKRVKNSHKAKNMGSTKDGLEREMQEIIAENQKLIQENQHLSENNEQLLKEKKNLLNRINRKEMSLLRKL